MKSNNYLTQLTGLYPVPKTLKFSPDPIGKTQEWIISKNILVNDEKINEEYKVVKKIVDNIHRDFITNSLLNVNIEWENLYDLYIKYDKIGKGGDKKTITKEIEKEETKLRNEIANLFKSNNKYFNENELINNEDNDNFENEEDEDFDDDVEVKGKESKKIGFNSLFQKELFNKIINKQNLDADKKASVLTFNKFSTYFTGFHENRKNVYTAENIPTAVPYRIVNKNFEEYYNNLNLINNQLNKELNNKEKINISDKIIITSFFKQIQDENYFDELNLDKFNQNILQNKSIKDIIQEIKNNFSVIDKFNMCLNQNGIDYYNEYIGVLNLCINLYRQKNKLTKSQIPNATVLYKQILSEKGFDHRDKEPFKNDSELIESLKKFYEINLIGFEISTKEKKNVLNEFVDIINGLANNEYNVKGIIIKNDAINNLSNEIFGDWHFIQEALEKKSFENFPEKDKKGKILKKNIDNRRKFIKKDFSIHDLDKFISEFILNIKQKKEHTIFNNPKRQKFVESETPILEYFTNKSNIEVSPKLQNKEAVNINSIFNVINNINTYYNDFKDCIKNIENESEILYKIEGKEKVIIIKKFIDEIMKMAHFFKPIIIKKRKENNSDVEIDEAFYNDINIYYNAINEIIYLRTKCINYISQKPYKEDKFKLNFKNPTLANGWDKNKETDNSCVLLKKNNKFYLGIMDKNNGNNKLFIDIPIEKNNEHCYEKIDYKLLPGPNKMLPKVFFSKKGIQTFGINNEILESYKKGEHKNGDTFNIKKCHNLIDYFKEKLNKHDDYKNFNFKFNETKNYKNISEFYNEVASQGYKISFSNISENYINDCVEKGKLFLFEIYNKDFSEYSKGKPNLHTLYWQALFSEENLKDVVYKLNGEAELFFRPASIKTPIIHKKNTWLAKKRDKDNNIINEEDREKYEIEKYTDFAKELHYDIIKDKRYTKDKYFLHVPLTINFKANGIENINKKIIEIINKNEEINFIGIDRGEKNLLYFSVIKKDGKIITQDSLNIINNIDYHNLLDTREKERKEARLQWQQIGKIKDLKNGYLSLAIHKICELIIKYNAIVIMEDLNFGMKIGRQKIEKQVYQNFEKMLILKLNCFVDKTLKNNEAGSILKPLQLTSKFESFQKLGKQSGIIFYIPAAYTSKIDFITGFVPLKYFKHNTIEESKKIIENGFKYIEFNNNKIVFSIDYNEILSEPINSKSVWNLEIIKGQQRSEYDAKKRQTNEDVDVYEVLKKIFIEKGIKENKDIKNNILEKADSYLYTMIFKYINLISQMRFQIKGEDFILSPIAYKEGKYFRTNLKPEDNNVPKDSDANGAYHIALKGVLLKQKIEAFLAGENKVAKKIEDTFKISNKEWFEFVTNKK